MNCLIRPVSESDFEAVYHFINALEDCVFPKESQHAIFLENLSNPKHIFLLSEINQIPVGFLSCHVQNLIHHGGLVGEIQEFFIHQNYRGKGIGRQLINEILQYADRNNLKSIEVTTNKRRVENVLIYENLGFGLTHNKFTIYK